MQIFTRGWLVAIAGTLFGLLILVSVMAYRTIEQLQDSALRVSQTHDVLDSLDRLVVTLKDAETGQRGYLLTGDEAYLAPYRTARNRQAEEVARIGKLFAANPPQQEHAARLERLTAAKFSELAETVKLQRGGNREAAMEVVRSGQGREMMEEIQSLISQLEEDERELLSEQKWAHGNAYRDASFSVVAVGFVISAVVASFTWAARSRVAHGRQPLTAV